MKRHIALLLITNMLLLPILTPSQASWPRIAGEIFRTVLIEAGKKQVDVSLSDITKYIFPVVTVGSFVNQYKRTELKSYPKQPLIKTIWLMTKDHTGTIKWERHIWHDGVPQSHQWVDSNTPSVLLHFASRRCPWTHNQITYPDDLSEEFSIIGRAKVENYSTLLKDRRPDSVTYRVTTEAYKLLDPCTESSFNEIDPNRVDVNVVAVGSITIHSDGTGWGKPAYFSPTPFYSYTHAISLDEIFIGSSGGN